MSNLLMSRLSTCFHPVDVCLLKDRRTEQLYLEHSNDVIIIIIIIIINFVPPTSYAAAMKF